MGDQDRTSTACEVCSNVSTNQQCSFLPQGQSTILAPSLQLRLWFRNNGVPVSGSPGDVSSLWPYPRWPEERAEKADLDLGADSEHMNA
jgi:hypothetical protein